MLRAMKDPGNPSGTLMQRSIWWGMEFSRFLVDSPELRALMPEREFTLVVLPADDPEVAAYQLELNRHKSPESLVFVRIERDNDRWAAVPYLPLPVVHGHAAR